VLPHQPYWEQQAGCPCSTVLLPTQVKLVVPPQEPSGLGFKVDVGRLEDIFDVVDTEVEVIDVATKVGLELQVP
jgi:hypothetical protein